ncbi:MAG: hypothetical protein BAJATHORv1_150010 [Candidatus Thorarchaeota archaeon]|nr:MAG: hypothetical protein BAJATHORv1_150010 [Candidatus Thorarchaeota archaeon]
MTHLLREPHLGAVEDDGRVGQAHQRGQRLQLRVLIAAGDEQETVHIVVVDEGRHDKFGVHIPLVVGQEPLEVGLRPIFPPVSLSQRVVGVEVERTVEATDVGLQYVGCFGDLAEVESIWLFALAGVDEEAPEIGARPAGVVQPVTVDIELAHPVERVLHHPVAGIRVGQIDLGHRRYAEKAAVAQFRPVEGKPVAVGRCAVCQRRLEDGMLVRHVVTCHVKQDAQPALVGRVDQPVHRLLVAQARFDLAVVDRIVAVPARGGPDGAQPNTVRTQRSDVVQFLDHALQRAAAESIQVAGLPPRFSRAGIETVDHDMIDDRLAGPIGRAGLADVESKDRPRLRVAPADRWVGRKILAEVAIGRIFRAQLQVGVVGEDLLTTGTPGADAIA